jgi:hypothetical protein
MLTALLGSGEVKKEVSAGVGEGVCSAEEGVGSSLLGIELLASED